ncbi:MAG TPA: hypothetical protein VMD98_12460 [Bryocella sp.]|nr:hypothetical protein [Bryocella sp.]
MRFAGILLVVSLAASPTIAQQDSAAKHSQPSPAATPSSAATQPTLSQDQIRALIRLCADNDLENDKKQRDYTYVERQVEQRLDGKGNVKSTETKTYDVMEIYGEQVEKLIAKDDKPLSAKDAQKEDEKIQKLIDKRKDESDSDREKRLKKEEKDRQDELQFVGEVADAYNFKFIGIEKLDGRDNYVIDGEPKPGYQPVHKDAKILTKTRFRAWIDKDDSQVKKLDVEFIDDVSFGLILFKLHKGAHAIIETTRVNDEVWLQRHVVVAADVRVALLKNFDVAMDISDRDYKKFRTDTKVIPVGELQSNQ